MTGRDVAAGAVGIAGLGRMGSAMAERLLARGHRLMVWNRTAAAAAPYAACGVDVVASPAWLVAQCAVVVTAIRDDAAAERVYFGQDGLIADAARGKILLDTSTLTPETVRRIGRAAEACGARFVSAPVLGTTAHARDGQLVAIASGAATDIDAARPVLEALSRKIVEAGPVGRGAAMKLAVNLVLGVYVEALAESLALGMAEGLAPDLILDVLSESPVANLFLKFKMPILKGEESAVAFDIGSLGKDLDAALATASRAGLRLPATATTRAAIRACAAAGGGGQDIAALPKVVRATSHLRTGDDP